MSMAAFQWAVGILFLYLVWGSVMTQNQITLCKIVSENCPRRLSCNTTTTSLILVTQAETSFQSCSSRHCAHCCSGITVVKNDNFTKELQQHCNNKSTCDPTVIFKIYGFAQVSYSCMEPTSAAQSLPASTTSPMPRTTVKEIHFSATTHAEVVCPIYTYGSRCTPCGACKIGSCEQVTGVCPFGCLDGYVGKTCERNNDVLSTISTVLVAASAPCNVTAGVISYVTAGIVGAGVGVVISMLVAAVLLAIHFKLREHIYEEPLAMLSIGESSYETLEDHYQQKENITGQIKENRV